MPSYSWACDAHYWIVSSTVAARDEPSSCPKCGAVGTRQIDLPNIDKVAAGSWNQQAYNPGLGCWTKSWKHGREIAKSRGLEEVGDEPADKLYEKHERQRQETRAKRWADDRELVYAKPSE